MYRYRARYLPPAAQRQAPCQCEYRAPSGLPARTAARSWGGCAQLQQACILAHLFACLHFGRLWRHLDCFIRSHAKLTGFVRGLAVEMKLGFTAEWTTCHDHVTLR